MTRKELERYFTKEQGWSDETVKSTSTNELQELYEEFTNC